MADTSLMPPLNSAVLNGEKMRMLVSQLGEHAQDLHLLLKRDSMQLGPAVMDEIALTELPALLDRRGAFGARITYEYNGETWRDDLKVVPGGVRLIRVKI